jgi:hypothetical protein
MAVPGERRRATSGVMSSEHLPSNYAKCSRHPRARRGGVVSVTVLADAVYTHVT